MNEDRIQGRWRQFTGRLRERWGRLGGDDAAVLAGKREQFLGRLQQRHGLLRDEADKQLTAWLARRPHFRFDD
ncbi:hypothetical protein D3C78_1312510 [compost metagenome]